MWKWSQFTVVLPRDSHGERILGNLRTRKSLPLDDRAFAIVDAAWNDEQPPPLFARLIEHGFITTAGHHEAEEWLGEFELLRRNPRHIFPLLAITTACNMRCTYCYEEAVRPRVMTPEIASACIRWMERRIVEDGVTMVRPGLFGGEPLLHPRLLFQIMDDFAELKARYGIAGGFYASSNGVLLTDDLARDLANRGLDQLQISLDGAAQIHERRRPLKGGRPSFDGALRGIVSATRFIEHVTLKFNFDRENRDALEPLLDVLEREGLTDRLTVKLETIAARMPGSEVEYDAALIIEPDSAELADSYDRLRRQCEERRVRVSHDTAHTTPCMFSSEHGVIIGPDGDIYKCVSLVGRSELRVGNVADADYDRPAYDAQMRVDGRLRGCIEERCAFLPVCAGGCAFEAVVRGRHYDERLCPKEFLARHYENLFTRRHQGRTPARANTDQRVH